MLIVNLIDDVKLNRQLSMILHSMPYDVSTKYDAVERKTAVLVNCLETARGIVSNHPRGSKFSLSVLLIYPGSVDQAFMEIVYKSPLAHFYSATEFDGSNLMIALRKIGNDDIFGVDKYLAWETSTRKSTITNRNQKHELITNFAEVIKNAGGRRNFVKRVKAVVDELLMNAIYDAPAASAGVEKVPLAQLVYGCDGTHFALAVQDPFGALKKDMVASNLLRVFKEGTVPRTTEKEGAGLGLYYVFSYADHVVFNVDAGSCTEVVCLFKLENDGPRPAGTFVKSFNFFFINK